MPSNSDAFHELITSTETAAAWTGWLATGVPTSVPAGLTALELVVVNHQEGLTIDMPDTPVVGERRRRFAHPEGDRWDHAVGTIAGHPAYAQQLTSPRRSARGTAAVAVGGRLLVWIDTEGGGSPPAPLGTIYTELLSLDTSDWER